MSLFSWPELHGALTHFPIALLITAVVFDIAAVALRQPSARLASFWLLVGAVATAIPALFTGWMTGSQVFAGVPHLPAVFVWHRAAAFTTSGLALILLLLRLRTRDYVKGGPLLVASVLLALAAAGAVGYTGFLGGSMVFGSQAQETAVLQDGTGHPGSSAPGSKPGSSSDPASPRGSAAAPKPDPQLVVRGRQLFASQNCATCHRMSGAGGALGPDLTHEGLRQPDAAWQVDHLKSPQKLHPSSIMPGYAQLKPDDLKALAAFLVTRR